MTEEPEPILRTRNPLGPWVTLDGEVLSGGDLGRSILTWFMAGRFPRTPDVERRIGEEGCGAVFGALFWRYGMMEK